MTSNLYPFDLGPVVEAGHPVQGFNFLEAIRVDVTDQRTVSIRLPVEVIQLQE